jgi:hypothetical protein
MSSDVPINSGRNHSHAAVTYLGYESRLADVVTRTLPSQM